MSRVLVIDYGFCNLDSVCRAVQECGGDPLLTDDPGQAGSAERMILPGVGNFAEAMKVIRRRGWDRAIRREVLENGIPLLGICLGMQLLADRGTEGGDSEGLGLVPGRVIRLPKVRPDLRIPHVGWNEVAQTRSSPLFEGVPDRKDFYFVHAYHFEVAEPSDVLGVTTHGPDFASIVGRGRVVGTQFHPEKSLRYGLALLRNFLSAF
ncbi:MAG TPA: imidazole glycerol phosphate synthase subunit HisH [Kiritimatiellia bacterium]|nr:imidazole glycerol phosphate synthase subunit HisH [Kiritimatiellia bacterium]HRZ11481.1 imidazole glycerol phosphate synthase subunit HisH [Kiritimatiellia bacterium]HSA16968.1 imidazole glycerol phosphate synthase subunit HisH [Kiritimatiellia bacterium]